MGQHHEGNGPYQFDPTRTSAACKAVTLGGAMDGCLSDPKEIITMLRENCGHASADLLRWVLVDSDWEDVHLANYVDAVLEQCEICRAFGRDPHVPIAGP